MCSLSSTLRYCCVGPAPFDDIGDIPYQDSRKDPTLPRLSSDCDTGPGDHVPVQALSNRPDSHPSSSSAKHRGKGTDSRHSEEIVSSGTALGSQERNNCNTSSWNDHRCFSNSRIDHSRSNHYECGHGTGCVKNDLIRDDDIPIDYFANSCELCDDGGCHDDVSANNHHSAVSHNPRDVTLRQRSSHCRVSVPCRFDNLEITDLRPECPSSQYGQGEPTRGRRSSRRCAKEKRNILPPVWKERKIVLPLPCITSHLPLPLFAPRGVPHGPLFGFPRHAWEDTSQQST